jgi:hypothetical protein
MSLLNGTPAILRLGFLHRHPDFSEGKQQTTPLCRNCSIARTCSAYNGIHLTC